MKSQKIHTIHGLMEREQLKVKDVVSEEENARVTATEWYHGDELVRRDVNVNMLRGINLDSKQEEM